MMGAMSAAAGVTGSRAWLRTRLTPKVMKRVTVGLVAAGLCAAALIPGSAPSQPSGQGASVQQAGR
jgi:hypothetical protein